MADCDGTPDCAHCSYEALKATYAHHVYTNNMENSFFALVGDKTDVEFIGLSYRIPLADMEENRQRINYLRAFGRFPIPLYMTEHNPLPLIYWPENSYDHGKRLTFPRPRSK